MDKQRIAGLDILRSIAIIFVVFTHSKHFLASYFPIISKLVYPRGSDIFFVLSGYLIGIILIKKIEAHHTFNFQLLIDFLKRRGFRTLPNYFLFLFLNIFLIYIGLIKGELNKYLITYFVFFQNFYKPYDFLFWESWSLSIQEWFYLSFPAVLVLFFSFNKSRHKTMIVFFSVILLFLIFPLLYRFSQPDPADYMHWDLFFRKLVITRFDTLGMGLLGAFIRNYYPVFWNKIKNWSLIAGCILIVLLYSLAFEQHVLFFKTIYLTLTGFSILLFLPFFENIKKENIRFKPFQLISKLSYSMFLIHIPAHQLLLAPDAVSGRTGAILLYTGYWIVILLLSKFIYTYFEKPVMDFGERFRSFS